ncbi:hypothetical protein PFLmoz3_05785 [Pseudomonas fluorescens]|uniref:Uncharacterized protein n=1 Tax=Pseudomonas fluorescens TaxID=294 RepID=A0A125QHK0_PSEFL|nr:hypothetical protein PFLmoz3_05785 [Pseudomonas fluorescens]
MCGSPSMRCGRTGKRRNGALSGSPANRCSTRMAGISTTSPTATRASTCYGSSGWWAAPMSCRPITACTSAAPPITWTPTAKRRASCWTPAWVAQPRVSTGTSKPCCNAARWAARRFAPGPVAAAPATPLTRWPGSRVSACNWISLPVTARPVTAGSAPSTRCSPMAITFPWRATPATAT